MAQDIQKNYESISPSAKMLLSGKGHTDIPFAKEAAELISLPEKYVPDFQSREFIKWIRIIHFELRYKSIDELMSGLTATNILELSSGFSFRGLHMTLNNNVHYIDTDLPDIIHTKQALIQELQKTLPRPVGKLELLPLNALDEAQFKSTTDRFPAGALTIVNEGLLMYLGLEEKKKLCGMIRNVLQERDGCWITADIYIRPKSELSKFKIDDELQKFLDQHDIEQNKFESFEAAEAFFNEQGFIVDRIASDPYTEMSTFKYFLESIPEEHRNKIGEGEKIQATWRLKLA